MTTDALPVAGPVGRPAARPSTPWLELDVRVAADRYRRLARSLPGAHVHYAVKANPEPALLRTLVREGASFDVASPAEVELCLDAGADPATLSYGNTIKKAGDIRSAFARGVRTYTFDCEDDLVNIARHAPGSTVLCRLLASGEGARWPLGRKFGCDRRMAADLLLKAATLDVDPAGLAFHVGSQQLEPGRWAGSIAEAASIFALLRRQGLRLRLLNAGGGFPVRYHDDVPTIEEYGRAIGAAVDRHFPADVGRPTLMIEPGRYVAAEAGVLHAGVVSIARKSYDDDRRWVYLDVGRFGGLAETENEAIRYHIRTPCDGGETGPVILAGPTCDSADVLYERSGYRLPLALRPGDEVAIEGAGAYTSTYSSVGFNGFPPLRTYTVGES
ncbi:type III PLP-dependent enzyme [Micromonospora chersina]|uniref:type III PLP-dependent enzyme n=1 Tax=Micromonospora chersina TaxID=47854 RepID=UPI0037149F45